MFVLSMIAPDGFPVAMAVCGSMEQAIESTKLSGESIQWIQQTAHYMSGRILVKGDWITFSIVECGLSLNVRSVFRS